MPNMLKKFFTMILIIIFCLFTLTGCYSAEGLETLAYAVAIGIDKGEDDKIRLSLQFAVLSKSSRRKFPEAVNLSILLLPPLIVHQLILE